MSVIPNSWELASLFCKLFIYFGAAAIVGGSLCLWLYNDGSRRTVQSNLRYITLGAFIGFNGALLNFFIQVGMVAGSGIFPGKVRLGNGIDIFRHTAWRYYILSPCWIRHCIHRRTVLPAKNRRLGPFTSAGLLQTIKYNQSSGFLINTF
ncbi:MAG: hypothetical protein CM1200mP40_06300 [Gammaproteobacteria bacterium]|nr:MAG: hypothetical protein CM1200mP40_06300 [Gammaproteobacteria bacterium]